MLGCSSVTRAIVPDGVAVAVRGLDRLSWAWFVAGFIPTSRLFSIDDGEYPHKRASRIGFGSGLPGRYPARARRGEPSLSGDDDPDRFAVHLRRERDAARRSVRAAVHELDLPDRCAQQQGRAGNPQAPAGTDGERAADPPARRQPASSHGDDAAAGRARVRGLAGRGDAMCSGPEAPFWHTKGMSVVDHNNDYADVPVLHITGWYDSWTRQVTMNYEALSRAKKSPQRLMIGPWTHGGQGSQIAGEVAFTPERSPENLPGSRPARHSHHRASFSGCLRPMPRAFRPSHRR